MDIPNNFIPKETKPQQGKATWASPSNIALVKYWGKYGNQMPQNPSLSFTLSKCQTTTTVTFTPNQQKSKTVDFTFLFEGKSQLDFHPKIQTFFERIADFCPYVFDHAWTIESSNSFPHSSGIASSASSMSALALGILSLEKQAHPHLSQDNFNQKASFLARLGSGSAARSICGPMMAWGKSKAIPGSAQEWALPINDKLDAVFHSYQDTILIIDKGQKKVSSSLGHRLMKDHPYAQNRFEQAHRHTERLMGVMAQGELDDFIELVELEALTLHALMMASNPYFILMQPQTLQVINLIWAYREATKHPLCFTLDAGANVHLLYPKEYQKQIKTLIDSELSCLCQDGQYIEDQVGKGAKKM